MLMMGTTLVMSLLGVRWNYEPATFPITHAEGIPSVVINEVAWAGSSSSSLDEWVELKNTTDSDIDLAGWQLTKDTSGNGTGKSLMINIIANPADPATTIIPASGYFIVANNGPEYDFGGGKLSVLNIMPNLINSAVTLSNSNLLVGLYQGIWNGGGADRSSR